MSKGRTALIRCSALALASAAALGGTVGTAAATSSGRPATSSRGTTTTTTLPPTLAGMKSLAHDDIVKRVNLLNAAAKRVATLKGLGAGRNALETYLGQDVTPLQQLDSKIQSDGSVQQATADYETMFTNFRVYRLVLPAARVATIASRVTNAAVPALQAAASKVQQHSKAADQATVNPLLANLNSQISTATTATNGLATTVLGYTPAQFNSDYTLLTGPQTSAKNAAVAVRQGHKDVQQIRHILKPASGHHAAKKHGKKHGSKHAASHATSTTASTTTTSTSTTTTTS
jgi:hypothetical protein